ncbi:hypothetical protein [Devosia sp.]|uniref:hypothetical protein n=1 Tax=Devosia sp. TaxID=1871048 RepID=UPI003BAC1BF4
MKQLFLAVILIIVPVAIFAAGYIYLEPPAGAAGAAANSAPLGDLSALKAIVTDVTAIAAAGDLAGAATRVTDFETAWDDAEATMRPMDPAAWGTVDDAADAALHALRAASPEPAKVTATLAGLAAALDHPAPAGASPTGVAKVAGIAVTDDTGHALPCETMLGAVRDALSSGKIAASNQAKATDFQSKATERCNADDDAHADAFSAQALALVTN